MENTETPDPSNSNKEQNPLFLVESESSTVCLHEQVLNDAESMTLLHELYATLPWNVETDQFGPQSRPTCYYGDPNCVFTYVGLRLDPKPEWHPTVLALKHRVAKACDLDPSILTACLINLYPPGTGHIPWHYDEVRAHGASKIVASLSLGGPRPFQLRSRQEEKETVADLSLESGSVLLMKGDVQDDYEHCLPLFTSQDNNDANKNPLRISLTFRSIVPGYEQDMEIATDVCCT